MPAPSHGYIFSEISGAFTDALRSFALGAAGFLFLCPCNWAQQPPPPPPHAASTSGVGSTDSRPVAAPRVPVIDVTDLYHPPQDPDDNFDLLMAYGLPEIDLRAVVLDCTDGFRQPVSDVPGMWVDKNGPREPGFIPVAQLNYLFDRAVPCAVGPFQRLTSPEDTARGVPKFQQAGIELILTVLRESREPVEIVSFGSARAIAAAFNREPELLRAKVRRIHLCAGASGRDFLEWNAQLDPHALVCLLRSRLPIDLYPCATNESPFAAGPHNTYWQLSDLGFVAHMHPGLRRYLAYAYARVNRSDFLRAMDTDWPVDFAKPPFAGQPQHMWTQAVWAQVAGRKLVRRGEGHRLLPAAEAGARDETVVETVRPCRVQAGADGRFELQLLEEAGRAGSNFRVFERADPALDARAWNSALPALYTEFRPTR